MMSVADDGLVVLANSLLGRLNVKSRIQHWTEINADVFITLFEGLCGEELPDVIRHPRSKEDEIHNCQAVIDTLSLDVLNTSLSHITGEDIVEQDRQAVSNLLDVFAGLMEYILDKIGSDISAGSSTDGDGADLDGYDTDPDLVTPELINSILERELRNTSNGTYTKSPLHTSHGNSWTSDAERLETTADQIAKGVYTCSPPSRGPEQKTAHFKQQTNGIGFAVASGSSQSAVPPGSQGARTVPKQSKGDSASHEEGKSMQNSKSGPSKGTSGLPRKSTQNGTSTIPNSKSKTLHNPSGNVAAKSAVSDVVAIGTTSAALGSVAVSVPILGLNTDVRSTVPSNIGSTAVLQSAASSKQDPSHVSRQENSLGFESLKSNEGFDISQTSSVSLPKPISKESIGPFTSVGLRERSVNSNVPFSSPLIDTLSSSLPVRSAPPSRHHTITHHLYHHYNGAATAPVHVSQHALVQEKPLSSSLPLPVKSQSSQKGQAYDNLHALMRDTVEMSRAAVESSPLKDDKSPLRVTHEERHSPENKRYTGLAKDLRSALPEVETKVPVAKTLGDQVRQSNTIELANSSQNGIYPSKKVGAKKNVSFANHSWSSLNSRESRRQARSRVQTGGKRVPPAEDVLAGSLLSAAPDPLLMTGVKPKTIPEYWLKYYGRDCLKSYSDGDEVYDSDDDDDDDDDYSPVSSRSDPDRSTLSAELADYKHQLMKKAKAVTFDDILDDSAPGRMGNLRRKLKKEEDKTKIRTAFVDDLYNEDLIDFEDEMIDGLKKTKKNAKEIENQYKKEVLKSPNTRHKPARKYRPSVSVLGKRSRTPSRGVLTRPRKRSASADPCVGRRLPIEISDQEIMPWLLEEFPYLHLTPQTMHHMWKQSARQIEQLSRAERDVTRKKSKAQAQIEEAEAKQKILSDIMKKELKHNQRLNEMRERRREAQSVKAKVREKRLQSARCRRYYEDYQVRNRSKMLKKRSKEELIFKKLFQDGLNIQKERIRELRKYAKEQRGRRGKQQQNQLESLENYYKDQYSLLLEAMAREREELDIREKAQSKVLNTMKRELRKKMEKEIEEYQEQLYRDEDEAYFRQLDADRMRHELNMAKYQAKV